MLADKSDHFQVTDWVCALCIWRIQVWRDGRTRHSFSIILLRFVSWVCVVLISRFPQQTRYTGCIVVCDAACVWRLLYVGFQFHCQGSLCTQSHGRPHIGINGVSWPPPRKNGWKIKKAKTCNKSSFLNILRAIRAGRCRERRCADHIFIQTYFRMHHFVVKFSKFSSPHAARGHWPS